MDLLSANNSYHGSKQQVDDDFHPTRCKEPGHGPGSFIIDGLLSSQLCRLLDHALIELFEGWRRLVVAAYLLPGFDRKLGATELPVIY